MLSAVLIALYAANPKDLRPVQGLVNAMVAQDHYDAAVQFLSQEKLKPGVPTAQLDALLADTALRGRKLDVAVQQYSRMASTAPSSVEVSVWPAVTSPSEAYGT